MECLGLTHDNQMIEHHIDQRPEGSQEHCDHLGQSDGSTGHWTPLLTWYCPYQAFYHRSWMGTSLLVSMNPRGLCAGVRSRRLRMYLTRITQSTLQNYRQFISFNGEEFKVIDEMNFALVWSTMAGWLIGTPGVRLAASCCWWEWRMTQYLEFVFLVLVTIWPGP